MIDVKASIAKPIQIKPNHHICSVVALAPPSTACHRRHRADAGHLMQTEPQKICWGMNPMQDGTDRKRSGQVMSEWVKPAIALPLGLRPTAKGRCLYQACTELMRLIKTRAHSDRYLST